VKISRLTTQHDPDPEEFVENEAPIHLHDHAEGGMFGHVHDEGWEYHQHTMTLTDGRWMTEAASEQWEDLNARREDEGSQI
jgi:hypothetical protein